MSEPLMDANSAKETYKFLNALLDDYNACKTDLARSGILKAYRMLVSKVSEDHLKQIEEADKLAKELADTKAKLPKSKEEIAKILNEFGFYELEEVRDVSCHNPKTVPLPPKVYAELYEKYYGKLPLDLADNAFDDSKKANDEYKTFVKTKRICNKTLAKLAKEEANLEDSTSTPDTTSIAKPPQTKGKAKRKMTKNGLDSK